MSRYYSYLNSAKEIVISYTGTQPFALHLKSKFAESKKFGGRDRRAISQLCFAYFRLGKAFFYSSTEERLLVGLFLCSNSNNDILATIKPNWNANIQQTLEEKIKILDQPIQINDVFPFLDELSESVESFSFAFSHFLQPDLFLRIRPGKKNFVLKQLQLLDVNALCLSEDCIALPNNTKIEEVIHINKDAVVQDYCSQQVGTLLQFIKSIGIKNIFSVWDCCAASGGKSIMASDIFGNISLTVSDVRESILRNLKKRFMEAEIKNYVCRVINLSDPVSIFQNSIFDIIIADVPCSGSGTWGRTPEQLSFFNTSLIDDYATLQRKICYNSISKLKPSGYFLYITCSVFKKENEANVQWLQQVLKLKLIKQQLFIGYTLKADTMFAALLQKHE